MSHILDEIDEPPAAGSPAAPVAQMLSTTHSPILADIDALIRLQLLNPFADAAALGRLCKKPARWVATMISTAAYRSLFEARRRELDLVCDLPTVAEEIEGAARMAVQRLAEKIETTDDGYLIKQGAEVLLKPRGQGGFAPAQAPVTNVLVDARQASILEMRERSLAAAREAGPYPVLEAGGTPPSGSLKPVAPLAPSVPGDAPRPELVDRLEAELLALPGARS